jgi:chorismate mutase
MTETTTPLDALRREADALDTALFDVVLRRLALAATSASTLDPAREAQTMRALARQWRGPVAPSVGLRMWREMLGATLRQHGPVSLHVADAEREVCELARAQFGSAMPMTVYPTSSMVVQALAEDRHAIGVVPAPQSDDGQPGWWSNLAPPNGVGPRIFAKLPFFQDDDSAVRYRPAYALASVPVTASGEDTTLVAVFLRSEMSRSRLAQLLKTATLDAHVVAMGHDQPAQAPRRFLVEVAGFLGLSDARLNALMAHSGDEIADIALVGAFANPVVFGSGMKP